MVKPFNAHRIESIFKDFWHNCPGFSALRPAEQWSLVFEEWTKQGGEIVDTGLKSRFRQDRARSCHSAR